MAAFFVSGVWLDDAAFTELEAAAQDGVPLACPASLERCTVKEGDSGRRQHSMLMRQRDILCELFVGQLCRWRCFLSS